MAMCKRCGIEKLSKEFPPVAVSNECDHPPLECLRVWNIICKLKHVIEKKNPRIFVLISLL